MKSVPMIKRILHLLLVVFLLLLPCLAFADEPKPTITDPASPSSPPKLGGKEGGLGAVELKAGEIIVKFKEGIPQASVQSLLLAENLSILDEMGQLGILLLSVPKGRELEKIEKLKRNPLVEYAEPNYMIQVASTIAAEPHCSLRAPDVFPNDPYFPSQWNLHKIRAPAAWQITTGSDRITVAFVDSGVDLDHPELKDKIWTNPGETAGNEMDDDGNGFVDDVRGWDFVNWDSEPQDDYGHGTFVAGIAAAETNNEILIAGVSWGAEIMPIKVLDEFGRFDRHHLAGAILYAADNGANIIDLSWSLPSYINPQPLQDAINYAHDDKGALVVAAAGDSGDDSYQYPGALDHVVSVAATNHDDEHPDFSTYNDEVDVAAPGAGIFSFWDGLYGWADGTGYAAAHVSGLAALIWSVNPTLTNDEIAGAGMESIIEFTAVDLGEPGRDDYFGHGRIDAAAAVLATPHYLEVETDAPLDFLVCEDGIPPSGKITNPNTNSSTWRAMPTDDWLSISDPEGHTPSSAMVSINKGGLSEYGPYTTAITATSTMTNCVDIPLIIPVTAVYTQCCRSYLPLLFKDHSSEGL
jgi:thermitase